MVKVCSITNYPDDSFSKYKEYFEKFNYPLHIFQKWALEGVILGNHVLVTAPTGSGKSLPAEFALDYFHSKNKKTIYCSPIKALSNQKYYDFSNKYPHITFGLITGDIKTNPDADVLIMTTEILLNKLYQIKSKSKQVTSSVSFDMDLENELACVVFDEIHMINDKDRGHVWENSIMLLPKHIQMIGLSATLDDPGRFAYWLENRGEQPIENPDKIVYLVKKNERAVPLTHYSFITTTEAIFKIVKDKEVHKEINSLINKFFVIQDAKGNFSDQHYSKVCKTIALFENNKVRVRRNHVLNQVSKLLVEKNMLPALCYVFSRKQIDICAKELTTNLLEFDSKIPYIAKHECDKIIRKLPNYQEYLQLPEYNSLVSLLEKGIATHHSGMMPVLREIVELFFEKGYIKFLFCTETVAIGLNLPVKTTIFTDINKHDGEQFRTLLGHEFVQASGRAGRLGLDTVGNVIHLHNLFRETDRISYKQMMTGTPQKLTSKFKISYNLLLNLIDIGDTNLTAFANKSMITGDIDNNLKEIYSNISKLTAELDTMQHSNTYLKTPISVIEEYIELQKNKDNTFNKKRKDIDKKLQMITSEYKFIDKDCSSYIKTLEKENQISNYQTQYDVTNNYIQCGVNSVIKLLTDDQYVEKSLDDHSLKLSNKGVLATHLREIHCLVFSKLIEEGTITTMTTQELVSLFSCFTNITVGEDIKKINPNTNCIKLQNVLTNIQQLFVEYQDKEMQYSISSGSDYTIHYELMEYVSEWCDCNDVLQCRKILTRLETEKGIFLGEFVKALLKINNISCEMEKIAEIIGNIDFLSKLKQIPELTLKYVVTNQSLYV
jgi:superfamily II RNA helicase